MLPDATLNDLIECCKDGEYGFDACAGNAKRDDIKTLFQQRAEDCRSGARELQAQIRQQADAPWRPERLARLQAVLPLPRGARGLCVFSEDPGILRHLQDPRAPLEQEWLATVSGTVEPGTIEAMRFPGFRVSLNRQTETQAVLRLAGKSAQGERFAEWLAGQLPLLELRRQRIGRLGLAPLPAGEWRALEPGEKF